MKENFKGSERKQWKWETDKEEILYVKPESLKTKTKQENRANI